MGFKLGWDFRCVIKLVVRNQGLDFDELLFVSVVVALDEEVGVLVVLVHAEHLGGRLDQVVLGHYVRWSLLEQAFVQLPHLVGLRLALFFWLGILLAYRVLKNILDNELSEGVDLGKDGGDQTAICVYLVTAVLLVFGHNGLLVE